MKKILEGDALEKRAIKLGIEVQGDSIIPGYTKRFKSASDFELQKRVSATESSIMGKRLWLIALISSIASVISAATAIKAVLMK